MPMPRTPSKPMPLRPDGKPMTADDIRQLKEQIASFDTIEVIADEMREIVERYMPDLVDRLPPKRPANRPVRAESPRKR